MLDNEQINRMLDRIQSLKSTRGIKQKGGKLYTVVADRIEALRREAGDTYRIETQLVHYKPLDSNEPVLVKAIITNRDGVVVATGHAEEWRDASYVNKTSAVENAETSAIGRALAALGLHGGEYASANEIEIAETKREHLAKADKPETKSVEVGIPVASGTAVIEVPATPDNKSGGDDLFVDVVKTFLPECQDVPSLTKFWTANAAQIADLKKRDPNAFTHVKDMFSARKAELQKGN